MRWTNIYHEGSCFQSAIAQLVEHLTVDCCSNQMVPGSIPGGRIFGRGSAKSLVKKTTAKRIAICLVWQHWLPPRGPLVQCRVAGFLVVLLRRGGYRRPLASAQQYVWCGSIASRQSTPNPGQQTRPSTKPWVVP